MRTRSRITAILCAGAFGAAAMAITFTWTGDVSSAWDESGNWDAGGLEGYPDDPTDDAILPASANEYNMELVTVVIEDLTISKSYYFGAAAGSPVLQVESFNINAGSSESAIQVTITDAEIRTHE